MATDYYVVYDTITNRYVKEKLCMAHSNSYAWYNVSITMTDVDKFKEAYCFVNYTTAKSIAHLIGAIVVKVKVTWVVHIDANMNNHNLLYYTDNGIVTECLNLAKKFENKEEAEEIAKYFSNGAIEACTETISICNV